jgi:hypothetical protein
MTACAMRRAFVIRSLIGHGRKVRDRGGKERSGLCVSSSELDALRLPQNG